MLDRATTPFEDESFEEIESKPEPNSRQEAQEGLFTKLSDGKCFDVESYLESVGCQGALCRFELPSESVGEVVKTLFDEGKHYASLFPDTWGSAKYANVKKYISPESLGDIMPEQ